MFYVSIIKCRNLHVFSSFYTCCIKKQIELRPGCDLLAGRSVISSWTAVECQGSRITAGYGVCPCRWSQRSPRWCLSGRNTTQHRRRRQGPVGQHFPTWSGTERSPWPLMSVMGAGNVSGLGLAGWLGWGGLMRNTAGKGCNIDT